MATGLDPACAHVLERLTAGGWTPIAFDPPERARERFRELSFVRRGEGYEPEPVAHVEDRMFDGPAGALPVRIYEPVDARETTIVWVHGGGWVIGDIETHDPICRRVANATHAVVASIGYRLAPEAPHPAPLDDVMAALRWAAGTWPERRLAVGGDSAGGGLAAGAALRARDEGGPALAAQLLVYPALDPLMGEPSIAENGTGYFLTAQDMRWFYGHYLPEHTTRSDPYVNLLLAEDLAGLAPAVLTSAQFDPLRDEGARHAERLARAGVAVRHIAAGGLIHGYLGLIDLVPAARERADEVLAAFTELLG